MIMKNVALFILTAITLFACREDEVQPPFDNTEFYENHQAANWTKEAAKGHLQGRWKLTYTYCCPMSPNSGWAEVEDEYFELLFEGDSVKVYFNNALDQTQFWEFEDRFREALYLETAEYIPNTFGSIYFSEEYMLFHSSPMDGSDNYFQKID
jgi:hypothetical protein